MNNNDEKVPFFDKPENVKWILRVFYFLCVILVIADFIVHRHIYVSFEEIPAFYAIYGFIACVVLVVIAKEMRKVVMRDEDYYDKPEDDGLPTDNTQHSASNGEEKGGQH
jgi:hypothetical protein